MLTVYSAQDGAETVPTRLQDRTDAECYKDFKDEYEAEVGRQMVQYGERLTQKVSKCPDSEDKQRRLPFAQKVTARFPSLSYRSQRRSAQCMTTRVF